ncbi:glutathione S-transferase family protein [Shewanella amazonensis]|uniref:Putative glutathione S-transferase n=1 Tax=Shewanella amazonensis (strain ATCC BAA-1098 / SB2B) TaxID=326297 RepID=A1S3D4_SHEAM|nr:glutathione S-transferase family protein [Shewanella amazonensis]ABL98890.1 putative glutathione S-transferase [Shewanella amazonensis SB2B]
MLTLYIANKNYSSWSLRPWLLLTELGIPFEEKLQPFGDSDFKHFSPTAKVPCLLDEGEPVWDSLAIIEYLAESYPGVWPENKQARAYARCAAAEMHSGFGTIRSICTMNCGIRVKLHAVEEALEREWARIDELWQQGLTRFGGPFLGGQHFSAVDAFFAPIAFRVQTYAPKLSKASDAYVAALLDLPGMQSWYQSALAEPWRDEAHEQEAREAGEIVSDFRLGQ